jgi:peptidoglycan/xylan/chitin deacetylase (PgdA/CDA1 family)
MGHNETNTVRLNGVPAEEEPKLIARTVKTIAEHTGARPKGWLGAGLQETSSTLGHLCDAGIEYVADWCNDDQPYVMTLADQRKLSCVPYSFEINDKVAYEVHHFTPEAFSSAARRQFDVLYAEGESQARVMPIALHPYISGVAYRVKAVSEVLEHVCGHDDVWLATGSEIAAEARHL